MSGPGVGTVPRADELRGSDDDVQVVDKIIKPSLLRYPASSAPAELRRTALHRLMERYEQSDPFKFLIYAELAGVELGPMG